MARRSSFRGVNFFLLHNWNTTLSHRRGVASRAFATYLFRFWLWDRPKSSQDDLICVNNESCNQYRFFQIFPSLHFWLTILSKKVGPCGPTPTSIRVKENETQDLFRLFFIKQFHPSSLFHYIVIYASWTACLESSGCSYYHGITILIE